jgi:hydroxymethylpyrimidine pyrophosphatase-like HAD family hydrolase
MQRSTPYYLFFDFDETIFIDKTVPKATETAIKTAQAKGCKVYMNTGRTLNHLLDDLNPATDIKFDGYLCAFNTIFLDLEKQPMLKGRSLTFEETASLKSKFTNITKIKLELNKGFDNNTVVGRKNLSEKDMFIEFYKCKFGSQPDEEILSAYLEIMLGE